MKRHSKIVAIQGDSLNSINRKTDTTLLLALEAQRRGYKIYYYETRSLTFLKDKIYAFKRRSSHDGDDVLVGHSNIV